MQSINPDVTELLTTRSGKNKSFVKENLKRAKLQGVNLSKADLTEADLSEADLRHADLTDAILTKTQAIGTDFTGATLTGACIENWNVDSTTQLEKVVCEYIYLQAKQKERRPHNGNFAPGELAKLLQRVLNTVDLVFYDGVDWKAFTYALEKTKNNHEGAELSVRSMENKDDGVVVVRLNVSPYIDKTTIHGAFMQGYEFACHLLEKQHRTQLSEKNAQMAAKEAQIGFYTQESRNQRDHINQLFGLLKQQGEVQKLMAETPKYDLRDAKFSGGFAETVQGNQVGGTQYNYALEQRQNLAEAAAEIQHLLEQLSQTYPTTTQSEQMVVAAKAIKCIENNPTLMERILSALEAGSISALEQFLNHPAASFVINALEDWQKTRENQA